MRAALPYLLAGAFLLIVFVSVGREVANHLSVIETTIAALGPWGIVAFVVLFVVATSLLLPESLLCIAGGALFGLGWGLAAVSVGSLLAAMLQHTLAHRFLHVRIQHIIAARPTLLAIQGAVHRDEFRLQVLLRLTPLNAASMSYVLGAAGVRLGGFLVALAAIVPHLMFGVYFGYAGQQVAQSSGQDPQAMFLQNLEVFGGLVIFLLVMVIISRKAHRAVIDAMQQAPPPDRTELGMQP